MSLWTALDQAEYPALLEEVQKLPGWTPEAAEAVHTALVGWCERALAGAMKAEDPGAAALFDLLGRLRSIHGETALDAARPGTVAAWKAFEELLNERLAKLALLEEVQKLPGWTPEAAEAVHTALVGWCERALAGSMKAEDPGAAALFDLLGRLRSIHGETALDAARPGTVAAWKAFEELLNERLAKLQQGNAQRAAVLRRRHVADVIRELVGSGGSIQFGTLRDLLRVSDSTLSQVLARMEAARIVVRERQQGDGRTCAVRFTEEERQLTQATLRDETATGNVILFRVGLVVSGWAEDRRAA
jgi:DNA-binding MarR family transcriptional regulator